MDIPSLLTEIADWITNITTPNGITKAHHGQIESDITNEILARGFTRVTTTGGLASVAGTNFTFCNVDNYGMFFYSSTGTPNGTTIFAASGSGTWNLYMWAGNAPAPAVNTVTNADGTLTISPTSGNVIASLNLANANIFAALQTVNRANSGASSTEGFVITNNTAATAGTTVQAAPLFRITGQAWRTGTLTSEQLDWTLQNVVLSGNPPSASLQFLYRRTGLGYTSLFTFSNTGQLNCTNVVASGFMQAPSGNFAQLVTFAVSTDGGFSTMCSVAGQSIRIQSGGTYPSAFTQNFFIGSGGTNVIGNGGVSTSVGSPLVAVGGSNFDATNFFKAGDTITIGGVTKTITVVNSAIQMTCDTNWAAANSNVRSSTLYTAKTCFVVKNNQLCGVGITNPAAFLDIIGGTAYYPSVKLGVSTLLATLVNGALEYDGTHLYFTTGGTRTQIV